jgi:type I restriction enzyme, S subunit
MAPNSTIRLGSVCDKIGSGATPRGGKEAYKGGATALIRSQNIHNDVFEREGLVFLDDVQAEGLRNVEVLPNDVLLNITGDSVARVCQVPDDVLPARVNQHVAIIRPKPTLLDARFLRYALVAPDMQARLLALSSAGATRNALTKGMIEALEIEAPSLPEQKAIAAVLGALDDKIELNRRMNVTLEAMARALFQSWFVDFDPVRAKQEGRLAVSMEKPTAALFPGEFQHTEIGEIPQGWELRSLYDTARFVNGAAFKSTDFCSDSDALPVIKITELKDGISLQTKFSRRELGSEQTVEAGDLLYSWSGSPDTSLDAFIWTAGNGLLNQHIFKVVTQSIAQRRLVYYLLKYLRSDLIEIARNKQTTGLGHVTVADMKGLLVCYPPEDVLAAFDSVVAPIYDRSFSNELEIRILANLRNSLLPKLLSGALIAPERNPIPA